MYKYLTKGIFDVNQDPTSDSPLVNVSPKTSLFPLGPVAYFVQQYVNKLKDFKPISLCNITYKIISKIIAARIKPLL